MGGKKKNVTLISLFIAGIFMWSLFLSGSAFAACRTDTPETGPFAVYYGTLTVNGSPVQIGDEIRAYVDTVVTNNGCVGYKSIDTAGNYSILVYLYDGTGDKNGVESGDTINFVVCHNDVEYGVVQTPTFDLVANDYEEINLVTCTFYYRDHDGDDYGLTNDSLCLDAPTGEYTATQGGDCDDNDDERKPGLSEICDGKDNDCNDATADGADETTIGQACDGPDSDLCTEGIISCVEGSLVCSDTTDDTLDICNGVDDDCDASSADGSEDPQNGVACDGTDSDLCAEGTYSCVTGSLVCSDTTDDTLDICNGIDDDCNPATADGADDTSVGQACDGPDSDLCQEGTFSCTDGGLVCSDTTGDDLDICNGIDDDCDASSADGSEDPNVGIACDGPDSDLCTEGTFSCVAGNLECSDTTDNTLDLCNGQDDDCNPATPDGADETTIGDACDGPDSDLCEEGTIGCVDGNLECSDNTDDTLDICNGLDDDCDASSDDGSEDPNVGMTCDGPDSDLCEEGTFSCVSGALECSDTTGDNVEECNGVDDDCDGIVPDNEADEDGDGVRICANDCDDTDETVNPNVAYDLYNGVDNDCDTLVDEDCYFDANVTAIGQDSTDANVTFGLASADDYTLAVTLNCSSGETVCVQLIAANAVTQGLDPNDYYLLEDIRAAAGDIQLAWYAEVDLGASANPNEALYYPQLQWDPNDLGCNTGFGDFYTYALLRGHGNDGAVLVPDMLTANFYDTQEADNVAAEGETPVLHYTILFTTLTAPPAPTVSGPSSTTNRRPTWTWTSAGESGVGVYRIMLDNNDLTGQAETTATSYTPSGNLSVGNHTLYVQERNSAGIWSASGSKLVRIVREGASLSGIVGTPGLFSSFFSVPRYPITPSSPGFGVPMIPRFAPYPTITALPYQYLRYMQPSLFSVPQYPFVPGVRGYLGIPGPPVFQLVFPSLPSRLIYPY